MAEMGRLGGQTTTKAAFNARRAPVAQADVDDALAPDDWRYGQRLLRAQARAQRERAVAARKQAVAARAGSYGSAGDARRWSDVAEEHRGDIGPLPVEHCVVSLLAEDPEFADGLDPRQAAIAREVLHVPGLRLPAGPWQPLGAVAAAQPAATLLIAEGLLARDVHIDDRCSRQLFGPGDPLIASVRDPALVGEWVSWEALRPTRVAVLHHTWHRAVGCWPQLAANLHSRTTRLAERIAVHQAIGQLPRIEQRLIAVMVLLGERWGHVAPEGLVLDLTLTHAELALIAGGRRPTVTIALAKLVDEHRLIVRPDGTWAVPGRGDVPSPTPEIAYG